MYIYSREYDEDTELEMTVFLESCMKSFIYLVLCVFLQKFGSFDILRVGTSAVVLGQGNGG